MTENIRLRIENLSERECEFELVIIHQSLRCAHIPRETHNIKPVRSAPFQSFADEAGKVFDEIWEQRIVCPSGMAGWLDHISDGSHFGYLTLTYGMGEGGIAAFAAEYYAVKGDFRAECVIRNFLDKFSGLVTRFCSNGKLDFLTDYLGITSMGGTIKAALLAARVLDSKKDIRTVIEAVGFMSGLSAKKITLIDFYSGISGWLYLLCSNEELKAVPHYKELVNSLCDRILELQTLNTPQGTPTWDTLGKKSPISGLGHGIAGGGLALASANRLFPSEKLFSAIQNAFETQRALYSDRLLTWTDYRDTSAPAAEVVSLIKAEIGCLAYL